MATHTINVTVNGAEQTAEVDSRLLLVHFMRDQLRLTGTHIGCDTTHCGACTVQPPLPLSVSFHLKEQHLLPLKSRMPQILKSHCYA